MSSSYDVLTGLYERLTKRIEAARRPTPLAEITGLLMARDMVSEILERLEGEE
jgi:hypothetical protein